MFVYCSDSGLNSFPSNLPTHVRLLYLNGYNITYFEKDTFISRGLVELEVLEADFCELRKIDLGAFNGLTMLISLSMADNEISEIIPGTFEKLSRLEVLALDNNIIEHLKSDVFNGLVNIKFIGLHGNKLQYIHPDTFLGLSKLQGLQIPNESSVINSIILEKLAVSDCNASPVSVETFANIRALRGLDLSYNNLRSVDINILKALPYLCSISLYGNPLQCDCQLQELWRWCQDHNVQTAYEEMAPECDKPSEVEGMWWGVLGNGRCLQGNIQYYGDYKNTSYSFTPIKDMDTDPIRKIETEMKQSEEFSSSLKQYELLVSAVFFIFGTTSNIIIIMIITCNKDMRTVPNMYIINLAISDIIYLTVLLSEICAYGFHYINLSGDSLCAYFPFFHRLSFGLTAYSIAVFSVQRYRVTVNPLHVRVSSKPTWRSTGATICGVWIVAALFAIPAARSKYFCVSSLLLWRTKYYQRVAIFHLLVSCVLPLFVIAFSYIMMARHLLESSCSLPEETQNSRLNTRKNTAKFCWDLLLCS
jgi:Leucine-rich repeat (LRR) protein